MADANGDATGSSAAAPADDIGATEAEVDEGPADFHHALRKGACVLAFLSLSGSMPAFRASKDTRSLLSSLVSVRICFQVVSASISSEGREKEENRRRTERVRQRLPHSPASGPLGIFIWFKVRDMPLRRANFNRSLNRLIPAIKWEDCNKINVISKSNIDALDKVMYTSTVTAMSGTDVLLLQTQTHLFRKLQRLNINLTQLAGFQEDLVLPTVTRVKVLCEDAAFADGVFNRIYTVFPNLVRLHLDLLPAGLLPLCGPGFKAPSDLRMSLTEGSPFTERHANVFVASHLLSLPFSWSDTFFQQVQRLQMSELTEDLQGLSLENLIATLRTLPHLRRLGTVSSRAACLFDISRENCKLEELVLVVELEDVKDFFSSVLPLEQSRKRTCLRRLAVHLLCSDGAARLRLDVENAICAGWNNIASSLMRPDGWVTFSVATPQLRETVLCQLPWFMPAHFCLDTVDYGERHVPVTTPLDRPLPYYGVDGVEQPSGTLVAGPLKRQMKIEAKLDSDGLDSTTASMAGSPSASPAPSPGSRASVFNKDTDRTGNSTTSSSRGFNRQAAMSASSVGSKSKDRRSGRQTLVQEPIMPDWLGLSMVDAIEGLIAAAEKLRQQFGD